MFLTLVLLIGAEPVPTFKVENKAPRFVVVNKVEVAPVREYWGGQWGWMEKGADGAYRQVSGSGGSTTNTSFPQGSMTTMPVPHASGYSAQFTDSTGTVRTLTGVPTMGQLGGTNYCPPSS